MRTYEVECEGETHRIGLDDEGYLYALDHDEEEERIAVELGDEPSPCVDIILTLEDELSEIFSGWRWTGKDGRGVPFSVPMDDAVDFGHFEIVRLIDDIANDQELRDNAFYGAAIYENIKIMEMLFNRQVSKEILNKALKHASEEGCGLSVKWLIDHGARHDEYRIS